MIDTIYRNPIIATLLSLCLFSSPSGKAAEKYDQTESSLISSRQLSGETLKLAQHRTNQNDDEPPLPESEFMGKVPQTPPSETPPALPLRDPALLLPPLDRTFCDYLMSKDYNQIEDDSCCTFRPTSCAADSAGVTIE